MTCFGRHPRKPVIHALQTVIRTAIERQTVIFTSNKAVRYLDLRHLAVKIVFTNFREKKKEPGLKKPIMFIGSLWTISSDKK